MGPQTPSGQISTSLCAAWHVAPRLFMLPLTDMATLIPHTCSLARVKHFLSLLDSWGTKEFVCLPLFKSVMKQLMMCLYWNSTSTQYIHINSIKQLTVTV